MKSCVGKSGLTLGELTTLVRGLNDMSEGADAMMRGMESCDIVSTRAGDPLRYKFLIRLMETIRDEARKAAAYGTAEIQSMIAEAN